jgi:hypothetical protein
VPQDERRDDHRDIDSQEIDLKLRPPAQITGPVQLTDLAGDVPLEAAHSQQETAERQQEGDSRMPSGDGPPPSSTAPMVTVTVRPRKRSAMKPPASGVQYTPPA